MHGLKVGDQLLRINGFSLNQATHKEVLALVSNQTNITLKVKTVGVLPVKDKSNDPLTWRIVPDRPEQQQPPPQPQQLQLQPGATETTELQLQRLHLQLQQHKHHQQPAAGDIVRMVIEVPPKAKLGCGICRGPDWRPGIFVQFTKEAGPARDAGLRPGDQLLQCNGTPFTDIPFSEAVAAMKASPTLDLLVRRGAGCDLFPGESSGYNSSASSVAGGDSPSWDDQPGLEAANGLQQHHHQQHGHLHHLQHNGGPAGPGGPRLQEPQPPPRTSGWTAKGNLCTVIRLESPDNGWVSGSQDDVDATAVRAGESAAERTTVVVQVHRSEADDDEDDGKQQQAGVRPPPGPPPAGPPPPGPPPQGPPSPAPSSAASLSCSSGSLSSNSLSSAISQELQRRSEQRQAQERTVAEDGSSPPPPPPGPPPAPPPAQSKASPLASVLPVDAHKREQHERLMDEFRRAHRKMFAHAIVEANAKGAAAPGAVPGAAPGTATKAQELERERFMQRRQQLEQQHAAQVSVGLALSAARERGLRVERDRQDAQEAEREVTRLVRRNGPRHPPPPLPAPTTSPSPSPQPDDDQAVTTSVASSSSVATPSATVVTSLVPPPPAFTSVTLTATSPAPVAKVTAKPPLPASTATVTPSSVARTNGGGGTRSPSPANVATNGVARVNGVRPSSPANGVARVNGVSTASSANVTTNGVAKVNGVNASGASASTTTSAAPTNGINSIQQVRLRPVQHQQLQAQQQRLTHRTPSPAPYCPTPDYDSDSSGSTLHTASTAWTAKAVPPAPGAGAGPVVAPEVEMQSLDSLELLEPRTKQPRPPQTYFQQNRGAPTARPSVSVTIREYGGGNSRQPSKLTFLNGGAANGANGGSVGVNGSGAASQVADGLQSELAATLSRSNLRCRTDVSDGLGDREEAPKALDEGNRGNVTVTSVNGSASYLPKSNVPNGILKKAPVTPMASNGLPIGHGITPAILAGAGAALKTKSNGISTKTITFGAKATIINEKQVST